MGTSESRLAYPDCQAFFDAALDGTKGARLPFRTFGAARHFQTRLHSFRMICRKDNRKIFPNPDQPLHGRSEYDPLRVTIVGPDPNGEYWVYATQIASTIDLDSIEPLGENDVA